MKATVTKPDGKTKEVKNLGWLLSHAGKVESIRLEDRTDGARCGCAFMAILADETIYRTAFNSVELARKWVKRRCLKHAVITDISTSKL